MVRFKWRSSALQPFQQYQGIIIGHKLETLEDFNGSVDYKNLMIADIGNSKLGVYDDCSATLETHRYFCQR